jgi:hypothetical protein
MADMQAAVQQQTMTSQLVSLVETHVATVLYIININVISPSKIQGNGHHSHADSVVKIKSLPFDVTQVSLYFHMNDLELRHHGTDVQSVKKLSPLTHIDLFLQLDVIQFFEGFKMKANGVQLVVRSDNKPTGEVCASSYQFHKNFSRSRL